MATDSKQTNPTGTATDTSQQDWLELDQQGLGGETLKAKKWTAKSRLVDNSQHIGNIHTGTEKAVELDKSDTLSGDLPQDQTEQEQTSSKELDSAQPSIKSQSAAAPTGEFSDRQNNLEQTETPEPSNKENEQDSTTPQSGGDPLVFEEHFDEDGTKRPPENEEDNSPVRQQTTVSREKAETPSEQILQTEKTDSTNASPTPPPPPEEDDPIDVIIDSSASDPTLNASDSYGIEDNAVAIEISSDLTDTDGSETLSVTIEGVPNGATLSAGIDLGNGIWQLTATELNDLTLLPPTDSDQDFSLTITATSTELNGGSTSSISEVIDVFMEAVNDAPVITGSDTINITEDSMEGFSGYGETWEGDIYSIVTQEEMLAHLGITDVDSSSFTVSLANVDNNAWHGGIQANDSSFTSETLISGSANGDETVIQITQDFLDNYPSVDAQVGDFYFDHVDFDKLNEGETADISFSVVVSDGEALSEPQNFNIQVTGSNDAPVISGSVILPQGTEDTSQSFTTTDLLANATDIDTDAILSVSNVSVDPAQGVLTSNPDGTFSFSPKDNYNGEVTISYEITDGIEIVPATASLVLAAVNDNPIAVDDLSHNQQVQLSGNNTSLIADSSIIQDNSEPYTVSLDITPENQDYGYIISNGGQTGAASGFFVTRGVYGKDSSIYQVGVADENQFIVFQGGQAVNGQQSNLTFTYDGQDLTVYQNGVDITDTGTISIRAGRDLPMQNVTLGAPSNIPTSYEFKGETDNVLIYDSSLSASDVAQIQNGEIPNPDELLVHYSFEGDTPLADQSSNGHNLQPHGDIQFSETSDPIFSTGEDSTLTISADRLLANDTDVDGDTLAISAVSEEVTDSKGLVVGTAAQDNDGNIIFTPGDALDSLAEGENKDVNFTYTVSDGQGGSDTATVTVSVHGKNDGPIAVDDGTNIQTIHTVSFDAAADIITADGIVDNPVKGDQVSISLEMTVDEKGFGMPVNIGGSYNLYMAGGSFGFNTGNGDMYGMADASSLKDGEPHTVTAIFTHDDRDSCRLFIDGVEQELTTTTPYQPSGRSESGHWNNIDGDIHIGRWGVHNDHTFNGEIGNVQIHDRALTPDEAMAIENGGIISDGLVAHYEFGDTDNLGHDSTNNHHAVISGTPEQSSHEHEAAITTDEDTALTIDAEILLANDTDIDGGSLSITSVSEAVVDGDGNVIGTATQDDEGNILFTPGDALNSLAEGEQKEVSFAYTVSDGQGGTDTANVTVLIGGTNDAPVVKSIDLGSINEDQPVKFSAKSLLEGATDVDGDSLHILEVHVDKEYGTMEYGEDAEGNIESFAFVPNENFNGNDVPIHFTVSDGQSKTEGKALIDVTAVNDTPVIEGGIDLGAIKEDTEIKFEASDLLKTATDADGDKLSILDVSVDKEFGSIEYSTDKEGNVETVKFIPNENFNGQDVPINFVATDGQAKVEGKATIDVTESAPALFTKGDDIVNLSKDDPDYGKNHSYATLDGNDTVTGGEFNDTINGGAGNDTIIGGEGDDKLIGGTGNDQLDGGMGNDNIDAMGGDDIVKGGDGNDFITADGNDRIDGGQGHDVVDFRRSEKGVNADLTEKGNLENVEVVFGSNHDDTMTGGNDRIDMRGFAGNDHMVGTDGNDYLDGGSGDDTIYGGTGSDRLVGRDGNNYLDAGAGNDVIDAQGGTDTVLAGDGDDLIFADSQDQVDGGKGFDSVTYRSSKAGVTADMTDGGNLQNIEKVSGSNQNDTLLGSEKNDQLFGNDGDDEITGGAGNDRISGGAGNDTIYGGTGNDILTGGDGNDIIITDTGSDTVDAGTGDDVIYASGTEDTINGGEGYDTVSYSLSREGIKVDLSGEKSLQSIEEIHGSTHDDILVANDNGNNLHGAEGNDTITGGEGSDYITGGDGDDTLSGGGNDDALIGNTGDDVIDGGKGTDSVYYRGNIADYTITQNDDKSFTVEDNIANRDGTDTVSNIESFEFADGTISSANLIDGAVEGIEFTASSGLHGYTDQNGGFLFAEGDDVTFSIGGVILGVATADDVASGQTFLQDIADVDRTDLNDEYLENMATFLQSIDENSDAYDGIVVTGEIREALENVDIDLRTASEEDVKDLVEQLGKTYVDEDAAMEHVEDMLVEHTYLEHDEFENHIDDKSTNIEQGLKTEQKKESNSSVVSSAVVTAAATDAVIQEFNEADKSDLSLNIPSLTLPGEENEGDDSNQEAATASTNKQETTVQSQNETSDAIDGENQQQPDILNDNDLSNSLPSASLSSVFEEQATAANGEDSQTDAIDNSQNQDGNIRDQVTVQTVAPTNSASTGNARPTEKQEETEITTETVVTEKQTKTTNEKENLSTDELSITLDTESDNETQVTDPQANDNLDRFAADGKSEQTENSALDKFSSNDDAIPSEEMASVDELDSSEAENMEQVEDAGLSADDGIQEELPPESEQVETNIG